MFYCKHESYCIAEARSALQIWKARVCMAEAHGVRGFPPSCDVEGQLKTDLIVNFQQLKGRNLAAIAYLKDVPYGKIIED